MGVQLRAHLVCKHPIEMEKEVCFIKLSHFVDCTDLIELEFMRIANLLLREALVNQLSAIIGIFPRKFARH